MKFRSLLLSAIVLFVALACLLNNQIASLGVGPTPTPTVYIPPVPTFTPIPPPTPTPVPAARIESGEHALTNGDWDAAAQEFEIARQQSISPDIQGAALLGLARTKLWSAKTDEAVTLLEQLIQSYPDSIYAAYAYFYLGQAYNTLQRFPDASQAYQNYIEHRPGLVDGYVHELRGDTLFAGGDFLAATNEYLAALQFPTQNDAVYTQMKMARGYAFAGDHTTALALYDDLSQKTEDAGMKALITLRKAQSYQALGQTDQANSLYLQAVNSYPRTNEAYQALLELVNANVPVDELQRGIVDYYADQYGVAMAAFDRYLQNNPADPATAHYYYGLAAEAAGNYPDAISHWDTVIQNYKDSPNWADAWSQKAYTQWFYLDQYTNAVQTLLDFIQLMPADEHAPDFLMSAANIADRGGEFDQAIALYQRMASSYPQASEAQRAMFLTGILQYRIGRFADAYRTFLGILSLPIQLSDKAPAFYWSGKALAAQGDQAGAKAAWEQAASADPTGYYSERALDQLIGRQPFTPPQVYDLAYDQAGERQRAEEWLRTTFSIPAETDLSNLGELAAEPGIIRGNELWALGLYDEARNEFETVRHAYENDPVKTYRLMNYLNQLGLYRSAIFAARQLLTLAGMDDAATLNAPPYFNHIRFGSYHSDLIVPEAQEYGFHPLLIFSLVRQESLFESFIRSSAAASGLMQIIPSTGQEIAARLGWPPDYTTDDLYRPVVNIRFGVDYLDRQRKYFKDDLYTALAAYNGGPGNAIKWSERSQNDPDLFLELIDYEETRTYIERVYENFNIYRRLYDRTP